MRRSAVRPEPPGPWGSCRRPPRCPTWPPRSGRRWPARTCSTRTRSTRCSTATASPQLDEGAASLTAREREILKLLASGVSATDELADQLYISQKTVKNHLANIYEKLAVADRAQAAVEAIRLGLHKEPPNP